MRTEWRNVVSSTATSLVITYRNKNNNITRLFVRVKFNFFHGLISTDKLTCTHIYHRPPTLSPPTRSSRPLPPPQGRPTRRGICFSFETVPNHWAKRTSTVVFEQQWILYKESVFPRFGRALRERTGARLFSAGRVDLPTFVSCRCELPFLHARSAGATGFYIKFNRPRNSTFFAPTFTPSAVRTSSDDRPEIKLWIIDDRAND